MQIAHDLLCRRVLFVAGTGPDRPGGGGAFDELLIHVNVDEAE